MTARGGRAAPALLAALCLLLAGGATAADHELVLVGGRVMDPASGLDAIRHVGIDGGRIAAVSEAPLSGEERVDVSGLVVAPGFIDLHVHGQDEVSYGYMARDGVTTALDLEAGVHGIEAFLASREGRARVHYGAAAGHIGARVRVKHGLSIGHAPTARERGGFRGWLLRIVQRFIRPTGWIYEPADADERAEIVAELARELERGALGIGMGIAYTPGADPGELRAVFELAAARGVACFVHVREQEEPGDPKPLEEVLGHASATGAALHVVHVNSSSRRAIGEYLTLIEQARATGIDVTTEAYPYTAASTAIESALFDEGWEGRRGIDYADLQWQATGERLTEESFRRYRKQGGTVIIHMMEPEWIETAIAHPRVMVASDGMPMVAGAHPRGAGSHARVLAHYVRERGVVDLMTALSKLSLQPARRLEAFVPAMARKGRVQVGADADLTVFDPATVEDRASFDEPLRYSTGIPHVLVAGRFVVRGGELVEGAFPGEGLRAAAPSP